MTRFDGASSTRVEERRHVPWCRGSGLESYSPVCDRAGLTGHWVYPIFEEAEAKHGKKWGFYHVAAPVALGYLALGFVGAALADYQEAADLSASLV
jgi:hypothetical protein